MIIVFKDELGKWLKDNGLRGKDLCEILGVSRSSLYRYSHGQAPLPPYIGYAIMYLTQNAISFEHLRKELESLGL